MIYSTEIWIEIQINLAMSTIKKTWNHFHMKRNEEGFVKIINDNNYLSKKFVVYQI